MQSEIHLVKEDTGLNLDSGLQASLFINHTCIAGAMPTSDNGVG